MEAAMHAPRSEPSAPALPRLTRFQLWSIFAIAVTIFLFGTGPVWRHPWSMAAFNMAVLYSYLPIPLMVAAGLAFHRRLGVRALFLDTLELVLLKYSVTFAIALALWAAVPTPPPAPPAVTAGLSTGQADDSADPAPSPTPIAPERTGALAGVVLDGAGLPQAGHDGGHPHTPGALVFVEAGLEAYVFPVPAAPVVLENDGSGITPKLAAAQLHQPILARSTDGHLHTLVGEKDGAALFNVPLLGSGAPSRVRVVEAHGVAEVRCSAHQHTGAEERAHLAVFAHPFFAITGADGRFSFSGVPAGALRLAAWARGRGRVAREVTLQAGGSVEVRLPLGEAR
jgi:hypothetical protein